MKGLTLIEILAAITLLSLMMMGVTTMLTNTSTLSEKLQSRQASLLSAQIGLERIRKDLQMAYDEQMPDDDSLFLAERRSFGPELQFSYLDSPIRTLFERRTPGLKIARYTLEQDSNGVLGLYRAETPFYDRENIEQADLQLIARGILDLKFEFYDHRNDRWLEEWDDKGTMTQGYFPYAVRIRLEAADPELDENERGDRSVVYRTQIILWNQYEEV